MNKLEKLTAYLPYSVAVKMFDGRIIKFNPYSYYAVKEFENTEFSAKPFLKLITDIDFTPYISQNENDKEKLSDAVTDFIYRYESCPDNLLVEHFKSCPYCLMQWLLSEHYDVFGMIADGEAI